MSSRLLPILLALTAASAAMAQSVRITAQTTTSLLPVTDGSSVPVQSTGRETVVLFSITNGGTGSVSVNQIGLSGTDFSLTGLPALPATLAPNGSIFFTVRYTPVLGRTSTGQASVLFTEGGVARQISFTLTGVAPDYAFTLTTTDGRQATLTPGNRINFGPVRPGTPATWNLIVTNRGSGPGTLNSAITSGRDFSTAFAGPQQIGAGQEVTVPITFNPQARGTVAGSLVLDLGIGTATFGLDGTGAAPEFVFAYALRSDGNVRPVTDGGRLTFAPTPATATATAEIIVVNEGNGSGQVKTVTLGGSAFQLNSLPLLPATLGTGTVLRFLVQFTPPRNGSFTGSLRIETDDKNLNLTLEGTTAEPQLTLSYVDPQTRNTLPVINQGILAFPATAVDASVVYTMVLQNVGTGVGTAFVNSVSLFGGGAFTLVDLPSLPATVLPGQSFRFGLRFSPVARDAYAGQLEIETAGQAFSVRLAGQGTGPALTVEAEHPDTGLQPLAPGAELAFRAAVGQSELRVVRIANNGNAAALVAAITVTGTGFGLTNVPFLPLTLAVGESQTFTVVFAPQQPGASRGRLRIGDQFFDVAGSGLAPQLEFTYTNDAGSTAVAGGGTVVLTPARVGESSRIDFVVQNTGTAGTVVSTVEITPPNALFTLEGAPGLPLNLEPGQSFRLGVRFTPNNIGTQTAALRVNNTGFTLSGNARQPVPLPAHRVEGPSGVQQPLQQPAVGVSLASSYPLPLRGVLTLSFLSDVFSENPAVQFSSGGRAVPFTIPAGSVRAVFENGSAEIRLQTGTVAGTIQLRPTFVTQAGLDLTPVDAAGLTMSIARAVPRLLTVEVSSRTRNGVVLVVTGYSTTRTLRQMVVQVSPQAGEKLTGGDITLNLESTALVWFQSAGSQGFGGLFSLQVPLTFQRGDSTEDLVSRIASLGVTVSNELGVSNAVSVAP